MGSVRSLCNYGIVLKSGRISFYGKINNVVENYLLQNSFNNSLGIVKYPPNEIGDDFISLLEVKITDNDNNVKTVFSQDEEINVLIKFMVKLEISGMRFNIGIKTTFGELAFMTSSHEITKEKFKKGVYMLKAQIPRKLLNAKRYLVTINAGIPGYRFIFKPIDLLYFDVENFNIHGSNYSEEWPGIVAPKIKWNKYEIK
jgi:lipopolysaccharide transport system ATP-binding protein